MSCLLRVSVALSLLSGILHAQTSAPLRGPDGGTRSHVSGIQVLTVPARPFTAKDSIDWTRTLEDGTVVKSHLEAAVARDSQGRLYRERRSFVPAGSGQASPLFETIVSDPVAGTKTTCNVPLRRCVITGFRAFTNFATAPEGPLANGTRTLSRVSLGNDVMDDLNVVGTRETVTTNAGVVGNDRPLTSTREFWYSADLQNNLSVLRKDPREGTQAIHLIDLSRSEPQPQVFQTPAGYTVVDQRPVTQAAVR